MKSVAAFRCPSLASTPLRHVWKHTVGSGHATLALRADWQAQLRRCKAELGVRRVRFHGLLSDDMGTLVREEGKLIQSFFNVDRIFDALLSIGVQPYVELGFMPTAIASGSKTVFHYRGNVTPPRRPKEWVALVTSLVRHLVERYGIGEVSRWYFEVWNEPNLDAFWTGSQREYFSFYRRTALAIKGVDASLRVGGPATADSAWIAEFVAYCERRGAPLDFVSTHQYPTDALGDADTDTTTQLSRAPRDFMRTRALSTRRLAGARPVVYSEWSTTSNPRDPGHDRPFGAAFAARIAMGVADVVDGYSYWTFSDIFEENYLPSMPFHGGFGLLSLHGIAKPVYRAFELLRRLGPERLTVLGEHPTVTTWVTRGDGQMKILVVNVAMPRHARRTERVRVTVPCREPPRGAFLERIDDSHANPVEAWRALGSPQYPSRAELSALDEASRMTAAKVRVEHGRGLLTAELDMPPEGVACVTLETTP